MGPGDAAVRRPALLEGISQHWEIPLVSTPTSMAVGVAFLFT